MASFLAKGCLAVGLGILLMTFQLVADNDDVFLTALCVWVQVQVWDTAKQQEQPDPSMDPMLKICEGVEGKVSSGKCLMASEGIEGKVGVGTENSSRTRTGQHSVCGVNSSDSPLK